MELNKAINSFNNYKAGTFSNIQYKSVVPVKAQYKNVTIIKYSTAVVRFGIRYVNVKAVKETLNPDYKKNPNEVWVLKNYIKYNKKTDKYYLSVYTSNHKNKNVFLVYVDGKFQKKIDTLSEVSEYVLPSYFKRGGTICTYSINVDNVIKIGK